MARYVADVFTKKAKAEGYLARSAYKLLEIQRVHQVMQPGGSVLDLGCSPGAWLQVADRCVQSSKKGGVVLGVDVQSCKLPATCSSERVRILQADACTLQDADVLQHVKGSGFHAILSDMCHSTLGVSSIDVLRSHELACCALRLALGCKVADKAFQSDDHFPPSTPGDGQCEITHEGLLLPGGAFVVKVLEGAGTNHLSSMLRRHFSKVSRMRPAATRAASREIYLIGKGKLV